MTTPWEKGARLRLRPALPGEVTRLVVDRDPGAHWWPPAHQLPPDWRQMEKRIKKPFRRRILSLSVNDWDHCHFRVREKLRQEVGLNVWATVADAKIPSYLQGRPYAQIAYFFTRQARRDWHNWTGKHLMDALVKVGVLADDSDRAVDVDRPLLLVDRIHPRVEFWLMYSTDAPRPPEDAAKLQILAEQRAAYTLSWAAAPASKQRATKRKGGENRDSDDA